MQYYILDFQQHFEETRTLKDAEEGVYIRLVHLYLHKEEPLPLDIKLTCKLAGVTSRKKCEYILNNFFQKTEDGYVHIKSQEKLKKFRSKIKKIHKASRIGGLKKAERAREASADAAVEESDQNKISSECYNSASPPALQNPSYSNNSNNSNNSNINNNNPLPPTGGQSDPKSAGMNFQKFIDGYPKVVENSKKQKAANIWKHDKLDMHMATILKSVADRIAFSSWRDLIGTPEQKWILDPATFLRDRHFEKDFERVLTDDEKREIRRKQIEKEDDDENLQPF